MCLKLKFTKSVFEGGGTSGCNVHKTWTTILKDTVAKETGLQQSIHFFADMLKKFNPNLVGFSTGSGPRFWEPTSHLNVAMPSAKSKYVNLL